MLAVLVCPAAMAQPAHPEKAGLQAEARRIDPQAQVLISEWKSAVSSLWSFSATVTKTMSSPSHGALSNSHASRGIVAFQRPNLMKWVSIPEKHTQIVSDGIHLYRTVNYGTELYATEPAPQDLRSVMDAGWRVDGNLAGLVALLDGDKVEGLVKDRRLSIQAGLQGVLNGEAVDTLVVVWNSKRPAKPKHYYSFGHRDHFPRQILTTYPLSTGIMSSSMTLSNLKVNSTLDAGTFTFIPPTDPIDPKVRVLLKKMIAACAALRSLSATVQTTRTRGIALPLNGRSTVILQRLNLLTCATTTPTELIRTVCDGAYLYRFRSSNRLSYQKLKAPATFDELGLDMDELDDYLSFPVSLFDNSSPIDLGSVRSALQCIRVGAPGEVDGTPVDTIEELFDKHSEIGGGSMQMSVGREDHLIRQVRFATPTLTMTVTLSNVRINPTIPASAFRFTPPAGSKVRTAPP